MVFHLSFFAGIVSRLPSMAQSLYAYAKGGGIGLIGVVALLIMIVVVVGLVAMMNEAERRIGAICKACCREKNVRRSEYAYPD